MSYREVERPTGIGMVTREDGAQVGMRRYALIVLQQMLDVGRGEQIEGLLQVQG
jgi:hypothetical protein